MTEQIRRSAQMLETLKSRSKQNVIDVEEEKVKLVVFSLGGRRYAFFSTHIKEILPSTKIFFVPGAQDFILGVINVRGDIESVVSINRFLGIEIENEPNSKNRILISGNNTIRTGIIVDWVEDVVDIPVSSIKPAISTLDKEKKGLVAGETVIGGKNITLLDTSYILEKIGGEA